MTGSFEDLYTAYMYKIHGLGPPVDALRLERFQPISAPQELKGCDLEVREGHQRQFQEL